MTPASRPMSSLRYAVVVAGVAAALLPSSASRGVEPLAEDAGAGVLEFRRVHVPSDRLSDVPLGPGRYVPMSAREFEEGIVRLSMGRRVEGTLGFAPVIPPAADVASYDVELSGDGAVSGTVSFEIGSFVADDPSWRVAREVALGGLDIRSGTMRTAAGTGEALVFGRQDGSLAIATPEPGVYTCRFHRPAERPGVVPRRFLLPLLPALSSSVVLRLPGGVRPVIAGGGGLTVVPVADDRQSVGDAVTDTATVAWRIDTGPRTTLDILLVPPDAVEQRLSAWTAVGIRGREALITLSLRPTNPWLPAPVKLRKDPDVMVTEVSVEGGAGGIAMDEASWRTVDDGRGVIVDLPGHCIGGREPLVVTAVAPLGSAGGRMPRVRIDDAAWIGGGMEIRIAPALAIAAVDLEHGAIVPPEAAARWPLASPRPGHAAGAEGAVDVVGEDGVLPARIFVEEQSPRTAVVLALAPRTAVLDVARVTAIDLSPGVVVGRATCDVRVLRGEAFDLMARITPGWFIDSVEVTSPSAPGEASEPLRRRDPAGGVGLDWRVQRDAFGDTLRIGLTSATSPTHGLVLRITGHRGGIALGEDFSTSTLDMVRFEDEAEQSSVVELRTNPDMTVEFDGGEQPAVGVDGRLAVLAEEGAVRTRMWAGHRSASRTGRLVRRRPPLDVRTQVRLTVRDDRLTESFTFECQPGGADLDSFVVQFSEPMDVPLGWSLLPPAKGVVSARRLDAPDNRQGQGGGPFGGERWLVEVTPAARGAVTIRGARTMPFTRGVSVPMAWVEGATAAAGQVIVRDVGRSRPRLINRRLSEVAPDPEGVDGGSTTVGEFSYGLDEAGDDRAEPAAELLPNTDARAWAWREVTSSWCHESGATEYETRIEIENQGRAAVAVSLPPGRRMQGMSLDGVRIPMGDRPAAGGDLRIDLPPGRQDVTLVIRTVAEAVPEDHGFLGGLLALPVAGMVRGGPACWRVEPAGIGIDVPVLHREWRLLLPPDLQIAVVGGRMRMVDAHQSARDWAARLLGAGVRPQAGESAPAAAAASLTGFRGVLLLPAGNTGGNDDIVVVVRSQVLAIIAVLVGLAAACGVILATRLGSWPVLLLCLLAGVATLWCSPPFDGIARAAWWAAVGATLLMWSSGIWRRRDGSGVPPIAAAVAAAVMMIGGAAPASAQDAGDGRQEPAITAGTEPLRVFITPADGRRKNGEGEALALVPEELFRVLVRGEDAATVGAVRVLGARVVAHAASDTEGGWGTWRLALDVDADEGGTLLLDQTAAGGRFPAAGALIDGVAAPCRLDAGGGVLRIAVPRSGRHAVEVDVEPAVQRRGETETATIAIPVTPATTLRGVGVADGTGRGEVLCERLTDRGMFVAASPAGLESEAVFDVSRSAQVRLVRSLVAGVGFAMQPKAVVSRNDITWALDECRLVAAFEIEPGDTIVRSVEVVADPGLEFVEPPEGKAAAGETADGVSIRAIGDRRFLVERRSPDRARTRFEMSFRLRLDDPVGAFDVPAAWLGQAGVDVRTVRFAANPSLAVRVDLPAGLAFASIPEGEASFDVRSWREEVVHPLQRPPQGAGGGSLQSPPTATGPRARLLVERRRQEVRGSQRLSLVFAAEAMRLHLNARIDASSTALVAIPLEVPAGCAIDRVTLVEDDALHPETAGRGAIDVHWTRTAETAAVVVVQRPRAGRFRLEVDARIPGRPAAVAAVPCLRAALAAESRTVVDWRTEDGRLARMRRVATPDGQPAVDDDGFHATGQFERPATGPMPEYLLDAAAADPQRRSESAEERTAQDPAIAADAAAGRVELADIHLDADERGRVWGVARFDMVAADRVVRLRLPPAWRLFDVSVDGRSVEGVVPVVPQEDNVWEFRLLDPGWPRSIDILFAGDLGRRLVDGEPFALPPPSIVGLPCRRVIWTLQVPGWIELRVQEPARVVEAERLQSERREAMARLEDDFEQSIGRMAGVPQERLRRFFQSRRGAGSPDANPAWWRGATLEAAGFPPVEPVRIVGDDGRLTIRAVRRTDSTTAGRAIATLSLLAGCVAAWFAGRHGWPEWMPPPGRWWPSLAACGGVLWMIRLTPAWPGAIVTLAGAVILIDAWLRSRREKGSRDLPPSAAGGGGQRALPSGETTTRIASGDGAA